MDNAQGLPTSAPSQGQAEPQVQAPMPSEAEKQNSTGGAVDTTPNQTPATGQPESGDGMILGKFKSQEDLVKAYTELESHNKKVEMERANLEKLFIGEQSTQETPVEPLKVPSDGTSAESQTYEGREELMKEVARISHEATMRAISPVANKIELDYMLNKYGDEFVAVAGKVAEIKKAKPFLSMEEAFKQANYDNLQRIAYNHGASETSQTAEKKVKAQVETSRPSGYRETTIEDAVKDPNISVAEIAEAMGPEYKSFAEISRARASKR